eukprot:m.85468 g.85468  ORF g.85468 m.85468 type:complete len:387 (+) comp14426_c0_seq2:261-1421(+)
MRSITISSSWDDVRTLPTTVYAPPPPRRRIVVIAIVLLTALLGTLLVSHHEGQSNRAHHHWNTPLGTANILYNDTYPLTQPEEHDDYVSYRIAMITDQDTKSRVPDKLAWESYLLYGELRQHRDGQYTFRLDDAPQSLTTTMNAKGRGAELSELQVFNGKLFTADDRTGIIYEILNRQLVPRYILSDGDGNQEKGFKVEWMAVKDNQLWVGSIGKDWTTETGEYVNAYPKWIKVLSPSGALRHINWKPSYDALLAAAGLPQEGYLWHECVVWSRELKRWVFLPRRASAERYDEAKDELRGSNLVLMADVSFQDIAVSHVGPIIPERGFSSFKVIPRTQGQHVIAIKTQELKGTLASFLTILDIHTGKVLVEDQQISSTKIEGVEFV